MKGLCLSCGEPEIVLLRHSMLERLRLLAPTRKSEGKRYWYTKDVSSYLNFMNVCTNLSCWKKRDIQALYPEWQPKPLKNAILDLQIHETIQQKLDSEGNQEAWCAQEQS